MADDVLRAIPATKGERRAALVARLAADPDHEPPDPVEPADAPPLPADGQRATPPSVITQGARTGTPGPAPPSPDAWIRELAGSARRGSGGVWRWPA